MELHGLEDIARELSDLEVALFLCLASREHCLIETTRNCLNDVAKELALIASQTFELSFCIVDCTASTTIGDIHSDILIPDARKTQQRSSYFRIKAASSSNLSSYVDRPGQTKSPAPGTPLAEANVVNVVIAKDFNFVEDDVQVQALQLMRTRKLATEGGSINAPENFLFIPLVVRESDRLEPPLQKHLVEHLLVSHFHVPADGFKYLEKDDWLPDGQFSASSIMHSSKSANKKGTVVDATVILPHLIGFCLTNDLKQIDRLRDASDMVTTSAEVVRYIQDIVVFLRLSRAVAGGISAKANNQFAQFAQFLAPIHGIDYLTPSIVALAARKVFRHRIIVASPEDDRSLQYGSHLGAVSMFSWMLLQTLYWTGF
ncbi:hypothetical protein N7450_000531 [Penicillium hetheringtonii]|uniref:magnesium chelatase n=1 Tax=Penicillium hetheringtonii TaxID=911720 RepID=A0AAD6E2D1_9EURO|nr:hypothetical protein N7450_000531 [Penicillium hetheringtonii]